MDELFMFAVPGPVVAWKRAQSFGKQRFTPQVQREYQDWVRYHALERRPPWWTLDGRYEVTIQYVPHDKRRRDIDNVAKTLMDSLNGIAWNDDSQVDDLRIIRHECSKQYPYVLVVVERLVNHA